MTWDDLLAALAPGEVLRVSKGDVPHPLDAGASRSVGLPVGQRADWRFPATASCRGLHAQDMGDEWRVHVDSVHPDCGVLRHLQADAPGALVVGGLALGALAGALLGGGTRMYLGALAGALLGAVATPSARGKPAD